MKLLKNAYFQLALIAALPFLALAAMNGFAPAPVQVASPDVGGSWYAPWTWGNQAAIDSLTQAVNSAQQISHAQATTWALRVALAVAVVAAFAKVFEVKKVRDPRIMDAAMTAVETFAAKYDMLPEEQSEPEPRTAKQKALQTQKTSDRPLPTSAVTA